MCLREDGTVRQVRKPAISQCAKMNGLRYVTNVNTSVPTAPIVIFSPLTYNDYYRHLEGKDSDGRDVIGLYVLNEDNTCHLLCTDFDDKNCEHGYQDDVLAFVDVCRSWNVPYSIERSRSGNGAHVWISPGYTGIVTCPV